MNFTHGRLVWVVVMAVVLGVVGAFLFSSRLHVWQVPLTQTETAPVKIRVGYLATTQVLPFSVGVEKGYFRDAGLLVEMVKFESQNQIIDSLQNGSIDFGSAAALGVVGIADTKNPGKIQVIDVSTGVDSLIVPVNSTLTYIADLKGKRLGILANSIQRRAIARAILEKNGLDPDRDVILVELSATMQVQAVASGQVDAADVLSPLPTVAVNSGAARILMDYTAKRYIADPMWAATDVVRTQFVQEHLDITAKVLAVIEKSIREIQSNPDAQRQYLTGYTALTPELINTVPLPEFKSCRDLNREDKQAIQTFFAIFKHQGVVEKEIDLNGLLYCKQ